MTRSNIGPIYCDDCASKRGLDRVAEYDLDHIPLCAQCWDNAQDRAWERLYGSSQSRTVVPPQTTPREQPR